MITDVIGWDIGGAHLKVAHMGGNGLIKSAFQLACPLWNGLDQLQDAIALAEQQLDVESLNQCRHAVTMTAELVDVFDSRDHGVDTILRLLKQIIDAEQLWIFCGRDGLLEIKQLQPEHLRIIASANWLATALFIADSLPAALIIDIGSTTTDIVAIENHQVLSSAESDYDRLLTDELVYTG
ncbi:MAG: hydantoinase/oxoprolinase family protein, partial [Methylococcales bacterium]